MAIHRLNHAVLYVRDVERSVAFYRDVLGFRPIEQMAALPGAAFLQAPDSTNDHDLGLFEVGAQAGASGAGRSAPSASTTWPGRSTRSTTWQDLAARLAAAGALVGASDHSTTKSLYGRDPDGLEFEIAWIVPADRLDEEALAGRRVDPAAGPATREIARYGGQTHGGIGISRQLAAQS